MITPTRFFIAGGQLSFVDQAGNLQAVQGDETRYVEASALDALVARIFKLERELAGKSAHASRIVGEHDEKAAFEERMIAEAGPGAVEPWIASNPASGYANERVNDYRFGWLAGLEWMAFAGLSETPASESSYLKAAVMNYLAAIDNGEDEGDVKRARHILRTSLPKVSK